MPASSFDLITAASNSADEAKVQANAKPARSALVWSVSRSALSRAARQQKINLATSSSDDYLYVWKTDKEDEA